MIKKIFIFIIFVVAAFAAHGYEVTIHTECVNLNDILGARYPTMPVQCGFTPGESRVLPSNVILTSLKRNAISVPALDSGYKVTRVGQSVSMETLQTELNAMYSKEYPEKQIQVENIRFGKELQIQPGNDYTLNLDLNKTGSANGVFRSGNVRANFSYTVKMFEEGYVTTERVDTGNTLADKVTLTLIDVTNIREKLAKDVSTAVAGRMLPRSKPVTVDLIANKPERVKGDRVLLVYDNGKIKLEVAGVAEGDAVVGKSFPVKNLVSEKVVNAVYQGNGKAYIN